MNPTTLDAMSAVGAAQPLAMAHPAPVVADVAPGFARWIEQELSGLNGQLLAAERGLQTLATGNAENLHDVMLQLEQARLAMQVASQVRSRVLEAYQDVMRMQV